MSKEIIFGDVIGKGKRGLVMRGKYFGSDVAVKTVNPKSDAIGRLENEGKWLKRLNKKGIGPKFYFCDDGKLVMEFLDGVHLEDFIESNKNVKLILKDLMGQCRILDKMKVDKKEMHRITKNCIVINKNKPILIDFERCRTSLKPKNVTQFCHFLIKKRLCKDEKKAISALKNYKSKMTDENFIFLKKFFF